MITGNPGLINYYTEFLSTIHNERNKNIDIIGVSNLGHFHGPHNSKLEGLYSLQDQINHKIQCFDKLHEKFSNNGKNNSKVKFVLCGHSIGAHICSQVLKTRPNSNIEHVYALFPTLQHIQKTPNGTMLSFIKENEVFFPLKFQPSQQATPDGTPCHVHTPVYQITAEKEYSLLVTFLETLITMAWVIKNITH
ncbi:3566_t:CDS:2 [Entrophospora sp. SA101]|nr:3566_t:CDS:2 [Entrophospora sp. SA101]